MRGSVIVEKKNDYDKWMAKQITFEKFLAKNKININKTIKLVKNNN
jgi:heme/copper-type cytochrome/quinol oxidase subunit 2